MRILLLFLLLPVIIFSESQELRKSTYYSYFPFVNEKIEFGLEIQKLSAFCVFNSNIGGCDGALFIENKEKIKKLNIDFQNFNAIEYNGYFKEMKPYFYFENKKVINDKKMQKKIEKIRKMLVINEITEKFENIKRDSVDYYSLPEIKTKTIFSEYIVIKLPELSYPFVLDFKNVKKRISDYEKYKGKNIDELYRYLVNITHNNTKITEKEYEKYYEFIEKEILYSTFYQELNKEVFELIKDLNLN